MTVKIAINGYGRIGRNILRALYESDRTDEMQILAINDLGDAETNAHLTRYDSAHGPFPIDVEVDSDALIVGGDRIKVLAERDPTQLPWRELGVDVVLECTGLFASKEKASAHLEAGARKVLISAPAGKTVDATIVFGVNDKKLTAADTVVSNASCTTNCLAPVAKVINDTFGLDEGLMTTIHAVTATQPTQDGPSKKDWRGGRNAYTNIIPSSTGAAKAVGLCIPELAGKLTGMAFRVPVVDVSVVDLTFRTAKSTSLAEINAAMKAASEGPMKGVLAYTDQPVVSSDFIGDTHSSIYDAGAAIELNDRFFKVVAWYDNEMGYACRCVDMIRLMAEKDGVG
ncbi:MAG: type I glyceraldehyde-3-phosphate dehydrogenase [Phycisphaerales bacterium]